MEFCFELLACDKAIPENVHKNGLQSLFRPYDSLTVYLETLPFIMEFEATYSFGK
jgi:hypothetical protein